MDLTAENIGISTTDTVEKVVVQLDNKDVGVRFADNALVAFNFVSAAVYFECDLASDEAFDVVFGGVDGYGFFHTLIIDKK